MALSTHFQNVETTLLPLPPPKPGQSYSSIAETGLKVALSLLQNHDYMMELSPLHIGHREILSTSDEAVDVEKLAADFNVLLTDTEGVQRVNGGQEWHHYEIQDQVPVLLGYRKQITFHTAMRDLSTGMETLTDPGSTVTIHGRYDVVKNKDDPSTLVLTERATTHCSILVGWYVKSNLGSSHADIHKTIKARFVEEMQKR